MKILVTGATGYIGNNLAYTLARMGHKVHALVRTRSAEEMLKHPNISVFTGDILLKESLSDAMQGCQQVYHTAAKVGLWSKDPAVFFDVNVEGTRNVLDVALENDVHRVVFTSSCAVIGPSLNVPMNETDPRITAFGLDYDLSKKMAEDLVLQYAKKGIETVIVSPSKVYGPGTTSHSLTANVLIEKFLKKKIAIIPSPGNFKISCAYIDDIVRGHIQAMERGQTGEKYILGGINISYYDFFNRIRTLSSCKGRILEVSKNTIKAWAILQNINYMITGKPPSLTLNSIDHLVCNFAFSGEKAKRELGYSITPLDQALTKTLNFLKHNAHE